MAMSSTESTEIPCFSNSECSCKHNKFKCESHPGKNLNWTNKQISFGRRCQQFNPYNSPKQKYFPKHSEKFSSISKNECQNSQKKASKFRYGNYHQYYGYRNPGTQDSRLLCMKREWLQRKDVLDIGCNAGHLTLSIARDFAPHSVIGIDIDSELVKIAKRNVRHYIKYDALSESDFPLSLVLSYGPTAQSQDPKLRYPNGNFPFNVQFVQGNYILPSDEMLQWQESYFDTVLCLSLTKWVHLNWGDEGVKRLFHRVYAHLRPGGCLILEAQSFKSYSKKKKITEEILKNYNKIQFFPEMFNEYLLKEVGFKSCELVDTPAHSAKGFSRPIYFFIKGDEEATTEMKPKHVIYNSDSDSESFCNYSDIEQLSD